ncbi:MAG: outer membrane beta-barrel protein [Bacteroidales bacterium]|nr:outer membrane beta-barrel protein [Bacteroidales bacterium]
MHYLEAESYSLFTTNFGYNIETSFNLPIFQKTFITINPGYKLLKCGLEANEYRATYKFNQLVLPIYLRYIIENRVSLYIGNEFGYIINTKTREFGVSANNILEFNNPLQCSPSAGISYKFGERFELYYIFSYGVTSLIKDFYTLDANLNPVSENKLLVEQMELGFTYKFFQIKE